MSNVKNITVRRRKRCVDYGSVLAAEYLDRENSKINFISIRYYGEHDVDFKNADHESLFLQFINTTKPQILVTAKRRGLPYPPLFLVLA